MRRAGGPGAAGDVGPLLAFAFPERIAKARGKRGEFLMANGRAGAVEPHDSLSGAPYLAIGEIVGRAAAARILLAAALSLEEIEAVAGDEIETLEEMIFDRASASLRARRRRRLGALTLAEQNLPVPAGRGRRARLARPDRAWRGAPAVEQNAAAVAGPRAVPAPRRRFVMARLSDEAWRRARLADALSRRQDQPCRFRRRDFAAALHALLPYASRDASTGRRRRISSPRPARRSPSTMKPKAARRSRCGCRNCSASPSIPLARAAASR